jgi:hypothetical protein
LVNLLASVLPSKPEPRLQIRYDGDGVIGGRSSSYFTSGTLPLPSGPWKLFASKLKSEHSKGRAIMVQFQSSEIDRFQLSIPITNTCDEGRLFVKAIKRALEEKQEYEDDQEQHRRQRLSSSREKKTSSPSNNTVTVAYL